MGSDEKKVKQERREKSGKELTSLLSGALRFGVIDVEFAFDWLNVIIEEVVVRRGVDSC